MLRFCSRIAGAVLCAVGSLSLCLAQTQASFKTVTSTSGQTPSTIYTADVNNDGIPDIIQDTAQLPNGFTVSLAKGDGTFLPPMTYSVPDKTPYGNASPSPMAIGDFNGDGNLDIVVGLVGTSQLAVFLGKGDGTFQTERTVTVALPSGNTFASVPIGAADLNGDGKLDLVAAAGTANSDYLYVIPGNGSGGFGAPTTIFTFAANTGFSNLETGDFDGDGKADVAFNDISTCGNIVCSTTLHVMYGNGALGFDDTTPYTYNDGRFTMGAGDLNGDGRTDIFGVSGTSTQDSLIVLYSQASRTFSTYSSTLPTGYFGATPSGFSPPLAMGDFNGDGQMDLVGLLENPVTGSTTEQLAFLLADGQPGAFTPQLYTLPTYLGVTNPVVGDFNGDKKPDVAVNDSNNIGSAPQNAPSYITAAINTMPSAQPATFTLSATSPAAIAPGASATSTVTINGSNGYAGAVTLSCALTSSPSGANNAPTCSVTGSPVTLSAIATTGSASVIVATTAQTAGAVKWFRAAGGSLALALLMFFAPGRARRWRQMLAVCMLVAAIGFGAIGCGTSAGPGTPSGGGSGGGGTVPKTTPTIKVTPASGSIVSNASVSVAVTVTGSGSAMPTGTVTISSGSYTSSAATLTGGTATIMIPGNSLAPGQDTLTASYSGDSNYNQATGSSALTVTSPASGGGTTAGTYTFTATGTGNDSAKTSATTTFTITVN